MLQELYSRLLLLQSHLLDQVHHTEKQPMAKDSLIYDEAAAHLHVLKVKKVSTYFNIEGSHMEPSITFLDSVNKSTGWGYNRHL